MSSRDELFLAQLDGLRQNFLAGLDHRAAIIATGHRDLSQSAGPAVAPKLAALRAEIHKLVGTAGTYGFDALSRAARAAEQACEAAILDGGALAPAGNDAMAALLRAMRGAVLSDARRVISKTSAWSPERGRVARKSLLLVDDDPDFAALFAQEIEPYGYDLDVIDDPGAMKAALAARRFSAIIMDVIFRDKKMAGVEEIARLRDAGAIACPVIFTSVRDDLEARLGAVRSGADHYLVKPIDIRDLAGRLDQMVIEQEQDPYRVLTIDDDPDVLTYNAALIGAAGMAARVEANPLRALGQIRDFKPDVILMDGDMPECSGFELAEIIRQFTEFSDQPIIFLTAIGGVKRHVLSARSGGDDFLEKSIDADSLMSIVRSRAKRRRERQRLVAALTRSEERLRSTLDFARIGVWDWTISTGRLLWSEHNASMYGQPVSRLEITFDDFFAAVHVDDQPSVTKAFDHAIEKHVALACEHRVVWPDGSIRWLLQRGNTIFSDDGSPLAMLGTTQDISDLKNAQAALMDINATLERRVEERTAELARLDRQFQEIQKLDSLGKLTGGIAHDFNNYLGVIIGNLEMLRAIEIPDAQAKALIAGAMAGAERSADLTRTLLAFARKQPLAPSRTNVNGTIENIVGLLRRTLGMDIMIVTELADDFPAVMIDNAQLDSALLNLANNARDAMPGGGTLTIRTYTTDLAGEGRRGNRDLPGGRHVAIEVADTGGGMSAETLERAFEPFFTTKAVGHGTGLGLSMVFGFVKQSGGHITLDSQVGRGTTVRIFLPAVGEVAVAEPVRIALTASSQGGFETILVVDDNEALRDVTVAQIKSFGYRVIESSSGREALDILESKKHPIDLLFTDVVMPGELNGLQLAERAQELIPGIKILMTSGFSNQSPGIDASDFSKFSVLEKPFRQSELREALRAALEAVAPGYAV